MAGLTIGKLAQETGVPVETIRFYERRGLIADPPRKPSGYRQYQGETVRRLRFIRRAKELGFSLREIDELLALRREASAPCGEVREQIRGRIRDVRERIHDLRRMEQALEELFALCESTDSLGECPMLAVLEETPHE